MPKEQISLHMENCVGLKASSSSSSSSSIDKKIDVVNSDVDDVEEEVDDGDEDEYETYEWAGQKRIRTVTMLDNPAERKCYLFIGSDWIFFDWILFF